MLYHGIEEKYLEHYKRIIQEIRETGLVKIKVQFDEELKKDPESWKKFCKKIEEKKEKYEKKEKFSFHRKRKIEEKFAEFDKEKEPYVKMIDLNEEIEIYNGEIIKGIEIYGKVNEKIIWIKFTNEVNAIKFALTFLRKYPESVYYEQE